MKKLSTMVPGGVAVGTAERPAMPATQSSAATAAAEMIRPSGGDVHGMAKARRRK